MEKGFVPYKQAFALNKLEMLPDISYGYYSKNTSGKYKLDDITYFQSIEPGEPHKNDTVIHAPLYQQAFEWFEKEHNIFVDRTTHTSVNEVLGFDYKLKSWRFPPITIEFEEPYDEFDREKANIACLNKLIEIIKK